MTIHTKRHPRLITQVRALFLCAENSLHVTLMHPVGVHNPQPAGLDMTHTGPIDNHPRQALQARTVTP